MGEWASWCSPCRLENRTTVAPLFKRFSGQGFSVYSVSIDNKKKPWIAAISKDEMTWTNVSDLVGPNSPVAKQFGVSAIPVTFLIDAVTKTILARDLRGEQLKRYVEEYLAR